MSTSPMAEPVKRPSRTLRPDTLGWLAAHNPLTVLGWAWCENRAAS